MSLYHEAAEVLSTWSAHSGGSLKSRIFNKRAGSKAPAGQLYALVVESSKWSGVLREVIERADLLRLERKLTPALALLLVHDLLLAKGGVALAASHGLRAAVERHRARLGAELTRARLRRRAGSLDALREQVERDAAGEEAAYPRWVRVNALKSSVEEQLSTTFAGFARVHSIGEVVGTDAGDDDTGGNSSSSSRQRRIYIDPHVPNLVAVTPGTPLARTQAYLDGRIILQDKASCFPAYLLDPRPEDGDVIDACAAPGNKTTHLAAILHGRGPQGSPAGGPGEGRQPTTTIYAFEKDARRAQTLEKMVKIAGAKGRTRIGFGQDFLQVDPRAERFRRVGALLLDPSCSGSGIVGLDSLPELHLPVAGGGTTTTTTTAGGKGDAAGGGGRRKRKHGEEDGARVLRDDDGRETVVGSERDLEARLDALGAFQLALLVHALGFPAARRVTYSTCSVHSRENEAVVVAALGSEVARARGWRILRREEQVSGMRAWPVRGIREAAGGDGEVAEGCVRSYKGDGHGVMGFFVAGFVREGGDDEGWEGLEGGRGMESRGEDGDGDGEGPYVRDEGGRIVRDVVGMPVLKATGRPVVVDLLGDEEDEEEEEEDEDDEDEEDEDDDDEEDDDEEEDEEDDDDEEEWEGVSDA